MYSEHGQISKMECFGKIIIVFSTILAKKLNLNSWEGSEYLSAFKYDSVLSIRQFSLTWQFSECVGVQYYVRVLNIREFWVCQVSAYASVTKDSEYAWIWLNNALWQGYEYAFSTFHRVLSKPPVLNMLGLRIWQGCEYERVTQGFEYAWIAWISLNMPQWCLNMRD